MVWVSQENTTAHLRRLAGGFGADGCGESIDGKSFHACIAIPKQEEAIMGFANDLGAPCNVVADLLDGELLLVGHGSYDLARRPDDETEEILPVECHGISPL